MTSRLLKQLFHPFLMMLMLMPFRASANDIVETFEGTSSIEKGQAGEIGYATQSASLSGGFQFSFTGGTLKVSEDNTAGSAHIRQIIIIEIFQPGYDFLENLRCGNKKHGVAHVS